MSPSGLVRSEIVRRALTPSRLADVDQAEESFATFCRRHGLSRGEDALLLHLTDLLDQGSECTEPSKRGWSTSIRPPGWLESTLGADVLPIRHFLRGLNQLRPLGGSPLSLPLYPELVEALVDAIMAPTHDQLRWRAAILLANDTGASAAVAPGSALGAPPHRSGPHRYQLGPDGGTTAPEWMRPLFTRPFMSCGFTALTTPGVSSPPAGAQILTRGSLGP